jgi:hypothetical protein
MYNEDYIDVYDAINSSRYRPKTKLNFESIKEFWYDEIQKLDHIPMTGIEWEEKVKECEENRDSEIKALRQKYDEEVSELTNLFRKDCEAMFGIEDFPEKVRGQIHYLPYEEGHAGGYSDILAQYFDLVEFAQLCKQEFSECSTTTE